MSAQRFERADDADLSAINLAKDDLICALRIGNDADPRTRIHVRDAMLELGNAYGFVVMEAAA